MSLHSNGSSPPSGVATNASMSSSSHVGLLSQTVFPSPDVRFVFPGRIRDRNKNDIIMVTEDAVYVKEIRDRQRLGHVAVKKDFFPSKIRAASVLPSYLREKNSSVQQQATGIDRITQGQEESINQTSRSLPPQILLLALEKDPMLMFLNLRDQPSGPPQFTVYSKSLPAANPVYGTPGSHLSVDPCSRAIAVGSRSKKILIFEIIPREQWDRSLSNVISRSTDVPSNLSIAKMEFLSPRDRRSNKILLCVVGFYRKKCWMEFWTWEKWDDGNINPSIHRPELRKFCPLEGHGLPTVMIPLEKTPAACVLACDKKIAVYQADNLESITHTVLTAGVDPLTSKPYGPKNIGSSAYLPIWKSWARPPRRLEMSEDLYIAREDGFVMYLSIDNDGRNRLTFKPDHAAFIKGSVDRGFSHVDLGQYLESKDSVVLCGDLSEGGFFRIGVQGVSHGITRKKAMEFDQIETIYNWTPQAEIAIARPSEDSKDPKSSLRWKSDHAEPSHSRKIFSSCSKSPRGAVSELRFGCELSIEGIIELDCLVPDELIPTRLWAFKSTTAETPSEEKITYDFLVTSKPHMTQLISYAMENPYQIWNAEEETLAIEKVSEPTTTSITLAQVTKMKVRLLEAQLKTKRIIKEWTIPQTSVAAIDAAAMTLLLINNSSVSTRIFNCDHSTSFGLLEVGNPFECASQPTCLHVVDRICNKVEKQPGSPVLPARNEVVAIIGTVTESVHVVRADRQHGIVEDASFMIPEFSQADGIPGCESVATINRDDQEKYVVLCGLRNGYVYAIELEHENNGNTWKFGDSTGFRISQNPVQVLRNAENPKAAFLCSGGLIHYMNFTHTQFREPSINFVWMLDAADRSFSPAATTTIIAQIPLGPPQYKHSGHLLAMSADGLIVGWLEEQPKPLHRRFGVPGTPGKLVFSEQLDAVIVISTLFKIDEAANFERYVWPALYVIDPNCAKGQRASDDEKDNPDYLSPVYNFPTGSRVTGLLEWFPQHKKKTYHMIVVSLSLPPEADASANRGRLVILKFLRDEDGDVSAEREKDSGVTNPVHSICEYDCKSFLYCSGNCLFQCALVPTENRFSFRKTRLAELGSAGVRVSVDARKPFIYVSTREDSLMVFEYHDGTAQLLTQDIMARNSLAHLTLLDRDLVLFSDKSNSVVGLAHPQANQSGQPASVRFEAKMSGSVAQLCRIDMRPRWKSEQMASVVERDILGTTTDGSLFSFSVVTEALWRLLRFIYNICMRDERFNPTMVPARRSKLAVEPRGKEASNFHVDGDLLKQLAEFTDAVGVLREMIDESSREQESHSVSRRSLLHQLVRAVLDETPRGVLDPAESMRDDLERTLSDDADLEQTALRIIKQTVESPF